VSVSPAWVQQTLFQLYGQLATAQQSLAMARDLEMEAKYEHDRGPIDPGLRAETGSGGLLVRGLTLLARRLGLAHLTALGAREDEPAPDALADFARPG